MSFNLSWTANYPITFIWKAQDSWATAFHLVWLNRLAAHWIDKSLCFHCFSLSLQSCSLGIYYSLYCYLCYICHYLAAIGKKESCLNFFHNFPAYFPDFTPFRKKKGFYYQIGFSDRYFNLKECCYLTDLVIITTSWCCSDWFRHY